MSYYNIAVKKYERFNEVDALVAAKLVTKRKHPTLPLWIYNYSASAQHTPLSEWTTALSDCRGLVLGEAGELYARPFRKFWNYEQVLDKIPADEPFTVWEKLDGSLGVVFNFEGDRVIATRGSFESDQAVWATQFFSRFYPEFVPDDGLTFLFEIIYPENRIVVDYGDRAAVCLLAVMGDDGLDRDEHFDLSGFPKARRFDGISDFSVVNSERFSGEEGFVVRWASGFRAKVKAEEYKRLHRLITQCSTRTIWELLRAGRDTSELLNRVPVEFEAWVSQQINTLTHDHDAILGWATTTLEHRPAVVDRKSLAEWATKQIHPHLLFALHDGKPISDMCWKLVEPKWATPFRRDIDA